MAVSKSCQSPSKAGWQHVAGTLFPARHLQQTPPRPCPAAEVDPQGRSVTMACRGGPRAAASCELLNSPAHRREGPRTISEIGDGGLDSRGSLSVARYILAVSILAAVQRASITPLPPYSPDVTHSARSHIHSSPSERDPSAACCAAGASLARRHPGPCIYSLFRRRGALASSFSSLPTLGVLLML